MKLVCLADTHNKHDQIVIPDGDVLIHAGDCTDGGSKQESKAFLEWFSLQKHKHKILVPGNHDFYFEKKPHLDIVPDNIHVLIDKAISIDGIYFWDSPVTPGSGNWAFQKERGNQIAKHWDLIPENTDVIISHTPPYGILDDLRNGIKMGCEELTRKIKSTKPKIHLFGHIHHGAGSVKRNNIRFMNATVLDEKNRIMHSPMIANL